MTATGDAAAGDAAAGEPAAGRPRWIGAAEIAERLPMAAAITALRQALAAGLDPAADPPRTVLPVSAGDVLLMPAAQPGAVGVKLATVAPANPAYGRPRVQAVYVLLDGDTLTPRALLDGIALTTLRTAAVSAVAAQLAAPHRDCRLVVFGTGPQAAAHVEALGTVRRLDEVTLVGRSPERATALAARLGARVGTAADIATADIVVCATSARTPVFDGRALSPSGLPIAIGAHQAGVRELDEQLMTTAQVIVEDRATALREAGDVILAGLGAGQLTTLAELVRGEAAVAGDRPRVFKSVGMAWEDLVVAAAIAAAG